MTTPQSLRTVLREGFALIGRLVRARKLAFGLAVGGAAVFAAGIVASALVIGIVADDLIIPVLDGGEPVGTRWVGAALAVVAVAVWKAAGIILRRTAAGWLQFRTQADLRYRLIDHQLGLRMAWFSRRSTGDLMAVSETDARQGTFILAPLPFGTGSTLLLIGTVVMITLLDPMLGGFTLVAFAAIVGVDVRGSWRTFEVFQDVQRGRGIVSGIAHESFDGALTVKALGREKYEAQRFRAASEELRDDIIHVTRIWALYRAIVEGLPVVTTLVLLAVGALRIRAGAISAGDLVTIVYLTSLLSIPLRLIGYVLWDLSESLAGWRRVQQVLEADDVVSHGALRATSDPSGAQVAGSEVAFSYAGDDLVIEDVEVDIHSGRMVAVVGPTASGKSTLAVLLARLWDPVTGRIQLDGRDLRDFSRSELPKEIALVAQETFLFDDDVRSNITMGVAIDDDTVEWAARLADADRFIALLPSGYDTEIGERGTTLSGGQQQRIALARALVRRPRLLILDDATSAVDSSVETRILRGLKEEELPSTVVIVAHRRASIALADEVVFLDEGRIVAHGEHEDLLASVPGYVRLLQAYEEDGEARRKEHEGEPEEVRT